MKAAAYPFEEGPGEAVVQFLLEKGADVKTQDNYGETALTKAVKKGCEDVIWLLIENGADIHSKDQDGETALMKVADFFWWNLEGVAWRLFEKRADFKTQDDEETARMEAAAQKSRTMVQLLLAKGADINARDKLGDKALANLVRKKASLSGWRNRNYGPIVRPLLEKGADIKAQANDGETALMKAVRNGYEELVELLTPDEDS